MLKNRQISSKNEHFWDKIEDFRAFSYMQAPEIIKKRAVFSRFWAFHTRICGFSFKTVYFEKTQGGLYRRKTRFSDPPFFTRGYLYFRLKSVFLGHFRAKKAIFSPFFSDFYRNL